MAKHFFKILAIFASMIILGLVGVSIMSYFNQDNMQATGTNNSIRVAE
jgi:hypothetical protein